MDKPRVVILGSGLATRLGHLTKHVPKVLITPGKIPGLVEIVRSLEEIAEDFTVVVHSKFGGLVQAVANVFDLKNLNVVSCDRSEGTALAIRETLGRDFFGKPVLVTWSDICLKKPMTTSSFEAFNKNRVVVFTSEEDNARYAFDFTSLRQVDAGGNVVGMYYFKEFGELPSDMPVGSDLADYITYFLGDGERLTQWRTEFFDWGDTIKLKSTHDERYDSAREFNSIKDLGRQYLKKALDEKGAEIIEKEIGWYERLEMLASEKARDFAPAIFIAPDRRSFTIEKLGESYAKHNKRFSPMTFDSRMMAQIEIPQILVPTIDEHQTKNIIDRLHELHAIKQINRVSQLNLDELFEREDMENDPLVSVTKGAIRELDERHPLEENKEINEEILSALTRISVRIEAYDKIVARLGKIRPILDYFGTPKNVNGTSVMGESTILEGLRDWLDNYYKNNYYCGSWSNKLCFIHGDPQFSNTIFTKKRMEDGFSYKNNPMFIDPRGYFGLLKYFGVPEYDFAKVFYSALTGYDLFNDAYDYHIQSLEFAEIPDLSSSSFTRKMRVVVPTLTWVPPSFIERAMKKVQPVEKAWLAVIWLGLAEYIKNDVQKCYAAYCLGLKMGTEFLVEGHSI